MITPVAYQRGITDGVWQDHKDMRKIVPRKNVGIVAEPPAWHMLPLLHVADDVKAWLDHYWTKLGLPLGEHSRLAITQDRREFARWTGRRLNPLALGCYCFLPGAHDDTPRTTMAHAAGDVQTAAVDHAASAQFALPGFELDVLALPLSKVKTVIPAKRHRHLIFIEPDLLPLGREVTIAHELIHLSDRVQGHPRKHHCHGYDSIAADEATITGYDPEMLRQLLRDESARREHVLRVARPVRYLYACEHCGKAYPRVRRYPRPVSCGACDRAYNPKYLLVLQNYDANGLHHTADASRSIASVDTDITV